MGKALRPAFARTALAAAATVWRRTPVYIRWYAAVLVSFACIELVFVAVAERFESATFMAHVTHACLAAQALVLIVLAVVLLAKRWEHRSSWCSLPAFAKKSCRHGGALWTDPECRRPTNAAFSLEEAGEF